MRVNLYGFVFDSNGFPKSVCGGVDKSFWAVFSVGCGKNFTRLKKNGRGFLACRDCRGEQNRIIDTDMRGWRFQGGAEERQ